MKYLILITVLSGCSTPGTYLSRDLAGINTYDVISCGMYACEIIARVHHHQEKTTK